MNIVAIILCGVWSMVSGYVWYSPLLFAKPWMRLAGLKDKDLKMSQKEMSKMFGTTFLLNLAAAFVLSSFFISNINTIQLNLMLVVMWWGVFTFMPFAVANFYNRKPFALTLINTGYQLVSFLGFAVIFSLI